MAAFASFVVSLSFLSGSLWLPNAGAAEVPAGVELNDVHSRLNATRVKEIAQPRTGADVVALVRRATRERLPISISGGRHAMGGQQFASGALHIDMSQMNRILALDANHGVATVQAGIGWPALIEGLLALQPERPGSSLAPWSIVQKQTGADELSIGGALSANAHGRGLDRQPFVQEVEAFRIVTADGKEHEVSRTRDPELFHLAIGGYGLFGVITTIDLRLQRRFKVRRDVEVVGLDDVPALIEQRTRDGYRYGDFQFKTDERAADFMTTGVFSFYKPVPADTPMPAEQKSLSAYDWRRLFALAHIDKARAYERYRDFYLKTNGQVYWSDTHQLSYYTADFESVLQQASPGYPAGSLMITEVYVPRSELPAFMKELAQDFREHEVNLIYGTVRLIRRDNETFLAWARQDYACIVMNLRVTQTPVGVRKAEEDFQRVIDRALARDGSYYLTYHRWARKDQVLKAYPQFVEFLKLKRRYDRDERFQSEWYRHYRPCSPRNWSTNDAAASLAARSIVVDAARLILPARSWPGLCRSLQPRSVTAVARMVFGAASLSATPARAASAADVDDHRQLRQYPRGRSLLCRICSSQTAPTLDRCDLCRCHVAALHTDDDAQT